MASNKKVVAIGEIGLDYHWEKGNIELQKFAFTKQINLANELKLPIVIHSRDAIMDTIEILKGDIRSPTFIVGNFWISSVVGLEAGTLYM